MKNELEYEGCYCCSELISLWSMQQLHLNCLNLYSQILLLLSNKYSPTFLQLSWLNIAPGKQNRRCMASCAASLYRYCRCKQYHKLKGHYFYLQLLLLLPKCSEYRILITFHSQKNSSQVPKHNQIAKSKKTQKIFKILMLQLTSEGK